MKGYSDSSSQNGKQWMISQGIILEDAEGHKDAQSKTMPITEETVPEESDKFPSESMWSSAKRHQPPPRCEICSVEMKWTSFPSIPRINTRDEDDLTQDHPIRMLCEIALSIRSETSYGKPAT